MRARNCQVGEMNPFVLNEFSAANLDVEFGIDVSESKLDKAAQLFVGAREVIQRSQQGCDKTAKRDPTDDGPGISEDASGCPHDSLVTFVVATCDHGTRGAGRVGIVGRTDARGQVMSK